MTKSRYSYTKQLEIMRIAIDCAKEKIDMKTAEARVDRMNESYPDDRPYPTRNIKIDAKRTRDYLAGKGGDYFQFAAIRAEAFLELTNNDPNVIKALREQQDMYLKKQKSNNAKLERLLDATESRTHEK